MLMPRTPVISRSRLLVTATTVIVALALIGVAVPVVLAAARPQLRIGGLTDGATLGREQAGSLTVTIGADDPSWLSRARVLLDGKPVNAMERTGGRLILPPAALAAGLSEGGHTLTVTVPAAGLIGDATATRSFTVDATPPVLTVEPVTARSLKEPITLRGRVQGATKLTANGQPVRLDDKGAFSINYPQAPAGIQLVATDGAGNTTTQEITAPVKHPAMRAVHITAIGWTSPVLREPILQMARQGHIDAVQLDIKDENGEIGYASNVPLAREIGAAKGYYDARAVIDQLHSMGVRVIGRLVAFRDPLLGQASWRSGHTGRVVQTASGQPYGGGGYGQYAFTNFADPVVRRYNIDLAAEAAALGFDDILYDYIRRPDGPLPSMRFTGLTTTPEEGIVSFLSEARAAVRPKGAFLGVSVFGIAATRAKEIAQDIPAMSRVVDYIAPMVYPSHWNHGEYGVANPNSQPYDITYRSLADFARLMQGTNAQLVPWLQDFSLGVSYGDREVAEQIRAAHDAGTDSFLLWNAGARYHAGALPPRQ